MRSFLVFPPEPIPPLPPSFDGPDVRFPARLVKMLLAEFTRPGNLVFDPFGGFGTTLIAAEEMNRVPCGVEWDESRFDYIRSQLRDSSRLFHGDSRRLSELDLPPLGFSLTLPPYMNRHDAENPLTNYTVPFASGEDGYARYLRELTAIYANIAARLRPGARAIVEVSNLRQHEDEPTFLAWDIARTIGSVLPLEREIVCCWEGGYGNGYDHSYCLVFRRPSP